MHNLMEVNYGNLFSVLRIYIYVAIIYYLTIVQLLLLEFQKYNSFSLIVIVSSDHHHVHEWKMHNCAVRTVRVRYDIFIPGELAITYFRKNLSGSNNKGLSARLFSYIILQTNDIKHSLEGNSRER